MRHDIVIEFAGDTLNGRCSGGRVECQIDLTGRTIEVLGFRLDSGMTPQQAPALKTLVTRVQELAESLGMTADIGQIEIAVEGAERDFRAAYAAAEVWM